MSVNGLLAPLFNAGFYYKTFMWPKRFWEKLYEPLIRRAAGLGQAGLEADPDCYETRHTHCDVLVIGSGVAGLSAARAAAETGKRVMLVEQDREFGGGTLVDAALSGWRAEMLDALRAVPDVDMLPRTTAIGAYDQGVVAALERVSDHLAEPAPFAPRQRLHIIRARRVVLATGTIERLIALPGNDRPGVMLATAARAYVNRTGVAPGKRAVFFVNNDEAYAAARDLAAAGVVVAAIVDTREPTAISAEAVAQGMPVLHGHEVCKIDGRAGVRTAWVRAVGKLVTRRIPCDLVCLSGGYTPQTQLATQAGLKLLWRDEIAGFAAPDTGAVWLAAGAAAGVFGRLEAARHGAAVCAADGMPRSQYSPPVQPKRDAPILPLWEVKSEGKAFVDLQHDVTTDDMRLAAQEGYSAIEHAKRYTTHGMGTDQGKIGGLVGAAVLAETGSLPVSAWVSPGRARS